MRTRISKTKVKEILEYGYKTAYWEDYDYEIFDKVMIRKRSGKSAKSYADLIIMADTETSKKDLPPELGDLAMHNHVCAWSIAFRSYGINLCVLWGVKPSDFPRMLRKVRDHLNCDQVYVYFHNLTYDWTFLRKFLIKEFGNPEHQLNVKPLYPISITFENGIILKDSLILAQRSLAKWGEDMQVEHAKAVGKWDYDLIRNQRDWRPNSDELEYISCDVLCGVECIDATCKALRKRVAALPLTATGVVRGECRNEGKKNKAHDWAVKLLPNDYETQRIFEETYHGGYTHGNRFTRGVVFPGWYEDVSLFPKCYDISSSYPYCLLSEPFPSEKFWQTKRTSFDPEYIFGAMDKYAMIFTIECFGVELKDKRFPMPAISLSKCTASINAIDDNGRILSADYLVTQVTEIDFELIYSTYKFKKDGLKIKDLYLSRKKFLPRWFTNYVYKRYESKTKLKGVDPVLYAIEKAKVNSIYGMTAQRPVKEDIRELYQDEEIDGELHKSGEFLPDENFDHEAAYQKYLKNRNTFLPYCIGIWVTSYAQRNLFNLGKCVGDGEIWIYSDTDSVYATAFDEKKIEEYNRNCKEKLTARGYGAVLFNDREYWLGIAEDDGTCMQFVQLHSKCYCKRPLKAYGDGFVMGDALKITVAGVPKKGAKALKNDIRNFKDGFVFDGVTSGKLQHSHYFIDEIYVDEFGNETGDSIDLSPCDYLVKSELDADMQMLFDEEVTMIDYEASDED